MDKGDEVKMGRKKLLFSEKEMRISNKNRYNKKTLLKEVLV